MIGETLEIQSKKQNLNEPFLASISTNQHRSASKLDSQKENLQLALMLRIKKVAFVSKIEHHHYKSSSELKTFLIQSLLLVLEMHLKI